MAASPCRPYHAEPIENCHPYIQWWRERTGIVEVTEEEIMRARIAYWALCDRTDQLIGEILNALEANDFMDNTIIIYTSDHGEQVGEHGLWWKQTFYEDSSRVPAIVSWPGHLAEGRVIDTPIDQFDLAATMLDAGETRNHLPQSHGMSVIGLINDPGFNADWKDAVFSEYCMNDSSVGSGISANLGGADIPRPTRRRPEPHGPIRQTGNSTTTTASNHNYSTYPKTPTNSTTAPKTHLARASDNELTDRVLDGWDPDHIAARMRILKSEQNSWSMGQKCRPARRPQMGSAA